MPYALADFVDAVPQAVAAADSEQPKEQKVQAAPRQTWQEQKMIARMFVALSNAEGKRGRKQRGR